MPALPNSVPHDEWEVHTRSLHGLVEEVLRRVRRLEEHAPVPGSTRTPAQSERYGHEKSWPHSCELSSQLVELHRTCRDDLATQRGLEAASRRHDLHVEVSRRRADDAVEELRSFTLERIEALRSQHAAELADLREGLGKANQDIGSLSIALEAANAFNEATYTSKVAHADACRALRSEMAISNEALRSLVEDLEASKSTRLELYETHSKLSAAHDDLHVRHNETRRSLEGTAADLEKHRRYCEDTFATQTTMREAFAAIEQVKDDLHRASEDRKALHKNADTERARLDEAMEEQGEHRRKLFAMEKRCNDVDLANLATRKDLTSRCDAQERAIKALDRRERGSWEQFAQEHR